MPGRTASGKPVIRIIGSALNNPGVRPDYLVPCGQCMSCRLERSRVWACRIMQESKFHERCCFLTLTYSDDELPLNRSLDKSHLRSFFKDLRGRLDYYCNGRIRYFGVGEYAEEKEGDEESGRPHYHAIVFGEDFREEMAARGRTKYYRNEEEPSRSGHPQWSHGVIEDVWPRGLHRVSELSFESAAYVARYALKKITGAPQVDHYGDRTLEFQSISNGIGRSWFEAYSSDAYPSDKVVLPGRGEFMPPRYYDRLLEKVDPFLLKFVKDRRLLERDVLTADSTRKVVYDDSVKEELVRLTVKNCLIRSM